MKRAVDQPVKLQGSVSNVENAVQIGLRLIAKGFGFGVFFTLCCLFIGRVWSLQATNLTPPPQVERVEQRDSVRPSPQKSHPPIPGGLPLETSNIVTPDTREEVQRIRAEREPVRRIRAN